MMDDDTPTVLHKRFMELLRVSGRSPIRVSQIAAILGISHDEGQYATLRDLLSHSHVIDYDVAQQTVRSILPPHNEREDEDEAALLALSDVDVVGHGGAAAAAAQARAHHHQRRSNSRHPPISRGVAGGYPSDTGAIGPNNDGNRSFAGMSRRRAPGGWSKPGQRALEEAATYLGPVGRVGYVCVADELHLGKLEAYYRAQGYYTKFDFDVLHVRFAQPPSIGNVKVEADATAPKEAGRRDRDKAPRRAAPPPRHEDGSSGIALPGHNMQGTTFSHENNSDGGTQPQNTDRSGSPHSHASSQGVRTAAGTSPTRRDYGSTRNIGAADAEGGEAPAASASAAAASSAASNVRVRHGFDLFIFSYGAVVWWGFDQRYFKIVENDYMLPHSAISHCMTNRYTTQLVNENYPVWCTYNLARRDTLEVEDDFKARLRFDHFVIPYSHGEVATGSVLMLCASHALAQSAKIDYIELQVQELADGCSPLPRELREKGRVSITERRLLQLRGEVLSYRLMLKSGSDLLDEPDFFWENSYLKPVFQATKEEFEISERVEALDNKLDAANEILSMLAEDFSQRHGARLEWIVIWLVFVEVVIGVLELLVDIRPWMHSR
ncbi:putative mitochondrial hypothetical protein [Leptomonas pyrrhocoris]|uniref:DUF155 domain-containing protein n=1 Tax=Leptomonas pyrrhocoris TaxID=157538 RepID=A0A0M9FUZ8_LEPPY|nr:putative mitochondrial hypothetical protein [Leptomonas pyrrhocoris]KPA76426.1 putative mitochondrial hypothetical protein [Leptomonas pyrrhocoris]|eukprot:XP_015654865.1 putative mitochondrial hypothetical protein [Leptomonas pyrrhocoris]